MTKGAGIQVRLHQGEEFFSVNRDLAHIYPHMITCVIQAFNKDFWPQLIPYIADAEGVTEDDAMGLVTNAKDAYTKFLATSCDDPADKLADVLRKAGWYEVPTAAQLAWLAMLGQVVTGQLFLAIRDLSRPGGEGKCAQLCDMIRVAEESRKAMNQQSSQQSVAVTVREVARMARTAGLSFADIHELIRDVEFGRTREHD